MASCMLIRRVQRCILLTFMMFIASSVFADDGFLKPSEAFKLSVNHEKREVHWSIAPGYYLYESRANVILVNDHSAKVAYHFLSQPKAKEDPNFGVVNVFHDQMAIAIPAMMNGNNEFKVTYQGCAEAGLCYPPQSKLVSFKTASNTSSTATANNKPIDSAAKDNAVSTTSASGSEEGKLVTLLLNGDRIWVLLTFFALGLGLTFTPCVLPMIPILAGIIAGQSGNITAKKGFLLSLSYVLGMSISYSIAGVLVGVFGAQLNLQALFQTPSVLISFSVLFVLLSLSMFGFYELQLPMFMRDKLDSLSQKSVGGPFLGVGVMGAISALIVSPCVSAPLAGALIYISTTGDAILGGSVLFVMSLGMGVPLLLVGLGGGKYLPKAGMWMMQVKAAFGVILLGVAIALVSRIVPETVSVYFWSVLLIVYAVHLLPFESGRNGWGRSRQGIALIMLLYGVAILSSGLAGKPSLDSPLGYLSFHEAQSKLLIESPLFQRTKKVEEIERLMKQAQENSQPVVLDMYADWCTACLEMEKAVFANAELRGYSNKVAFLQLDLTENTSIQQAFLSKYGVFGPPTLLFFSSTGKLDAVRQGEMDFQQFKNLLESVSIGL